MKPDDILEIRRLARARKGPKSTPIRGEEMTRRLRELCDRNGWRYGPKIGPEEGEETPPPGEGPAPERPVVEFETDCQETIALCRFAAQYDDRKVTITVRKQVMTGIVMAVRHNSRVARVTMQLVP
jgi:hypothetical protein